MICAPAFNHKIWNAAHSGVSEILFFTKSYKWKKRRWEKWATGRLLLEIMCFWRPPTVRQFQDGWPRMRAQQKFKLLDVAWQCPDYSLSFPCSISFAERFVTCLRNKAYVFLKLQNVDFKNYTIKYSIEFCIEQAKSQAHAVKWTCPNQDAWAVITPKWPKVNSIDPATRHASTRTPPRNIVQKAVFFNKTFSRFI